MEAKTGSAVQSIPKIILDNLPSGIIFCDADCRILYINPTYADYLGVDRDEVIGRPITDYIPGSRVRQVLDNRSPEFGFKCSVGEGKEKKILIVNRIPVREDGEVIGVISQSLFGDIGELKDLSERLDLLERKVNSYREKIKSVLSARYGLEDIKGRSPGIVRARELAASYARTESPVLLLGATGTGKELFAHALHLESERHKGPFVSINCAAVPRDLFESELFGYAPGAFTGAHRDGKVGQIELSDKGTLFLDEIGDMPLHAQVKLLRVLEDKMVYRLGSAEPRKVRFRLIAATNRDLQAMIREGKFREELYYRLNTMTIALPPLRKRKGDIPLLVRHILESMGRADVTCTREALGALESYGWSGNVRELKNVIERALSLCRGEVIDTCDLPSEVLGGPSPSAHQPGGIAGDTLLQLERKRISSALGENGWNVARTARALGISRAALYEKMKKYCLRRPS
ncbi:MAG: hypothetical protein Kow0025_18690 [Thermodesulfovibrionales bacterium]